jgi:tetratricopeptide (TPR) repeat protein
MTRDAWDAFDAPPATGVSDLDARLFSLSSNGRVELWHVARAEYVEHPIAGDGAGTFERIWQAERDASFKARDAHSLYFETLAELGTVGLGLVALLFLFPLGAGLVVRRDVFLPGVIAAFAAFVAHAGVDWDWEVGAVTLTALFIGALPIIAARRSEARLVAPRVRAVASAAVVLASIGMIFVFLGNGALDRAEDAVAAKSYSEAIDEANRARRLMSWSPWPLIARGDAELGAGDLTAAERSFRRAISIDPGEWRAWLGLAFATKGRTRLEAFRHARRLYPRSAELARAAAELDIQTSG